MVNLSSGGEDFDDAALDAHLATRATIARFFEACAAHGEALASRVVRDADCAGAVTRLARDAGLALAAGAGAVRARATAFAAAAEMARHADALALAVRDAGIVPDALLGCCETNDLFVPEAAATREARRRGAEDDARRRGGTADEEAAARRAKRLEAFLKAMAFVRLL